MSGASVARVVVADANVLINLVIAERPWLLGALSDYEFVVSDNVYTELCRPEQRAALDAAITDGLVRRESLTDLGALALYGQLSLTMGAGEAECLAIADLHGWIVLSDEKRLFRREAHRIVGPERLITTVDLFVLAIRAGVLTVLEADAAKAVLAQNRFVIKVGTFADLI